MSNEHAQAPKDTGIADNVLEWVDRAVADMDAKTEVAGDARIAWKHCGRGICAAEDGHAGTCDEASGWADEWDGETQSAPPRPVDRMTP